MRRFAILATFLASIGIALPAQAELKTAAEHAVLMDAASGQVLWEKYSAVPMPPASMSKLMTLDLLFQRLKDGRVKPTDTFLVSERAWRMQGSRMFLNLGSRVTVEDLIRGIIIVSGNDACVVVAEALGGSVESFAEMMNKRAKEIGLRNSHFVNPDGYPEPPGQAMSALDLAVLARHLIREYPQYYHFFNEREFTWNSIRQPNRNRVLNILPGADGLKTGHTDEAGFGTVVSAKRGDQRFILVISGLRYPDLATATPMRRADVAEQRRGEEAARLLDIAFREFRSYKLFAPDDVVANADVWMGKKPTVPLKLGTALSVTMQVESRVGMKVKVKYDGPIRAPIAKGQQIGTVEVTAPDFPSVTAPLYAAEAVPGAGFFSRIFAGLKALVSGSGS